MIFLKEKEDLENKIMYQIQKIISQKLIFIAVFLVVVSVVLYFFRKEFFTENVAIFLFLFILFIVGNEFLQRETALKFFEIQKELRETKKNFEEMVTEETRELKNERDALQAKVKDLEEWYKITLNRELKMAELKEKIKELEAKKS